MDTALPPPNLRVRTAGLFGSVLCTAFISMSLGAISVSAETTVETKPVGYTTLEINPGYNAVSVSMVHEPILTAVVAETYGESEDTIPMAETSPANIGDLLVSTKKYYIEVIGVGSKTVNYVGDRFEVDVAGTIASANRELKILPGDATNTKAELPDLSGYEILIREHMTLAQVFGGLGNMKLKGAGSIASADHIRLYDRASGDFITYWLRANAQETSVQWIKASTPADLVTDYSNMPIRPGVGLFVYRLTSRALVNIRHKAGVRTTPFRQPLPVGFSFLSNPIPVDHSPFKRLMNVANGFKGAGSVASADLVRQWNGTDYNQYYLRANANATIQEWRSTNASDTALYQNVTDFFHGDHSFFIYKQVAAPNYLISLP